jgi:hypothetical protein
MMGICIIGINMGRRRRSKGGKQSEAGSNLIKKLLFSDQITRRSS